MIKNFFTALSENKIFTILFMSSCFILLFARVFIGVDLNDAPYHLTSMLQVLQGKVPLMQIWDGHTGFFLMSPFIALYKKFVPDLQGLMIYYRLLSMSIAIIISLFNIHLLNKKFYRDKNIFLFFIPFIFTAPVMSLEYNTLTALLLLTSANLIYTGTSFFSAGITAGLMCLNYPTCAVIAIFLFAYVTFKHGIRKGIIFSSGVVIVGAAFFVWIFRNGSLSEFTTALYYVINSPHTANRGAITPGFLFRTIFVPVIFFCVEHIYVFVAYFFNIDKISKLSSDVTLSKLFIFSYGIFAIISVIQCFGLSHGRWYYISNLIITLLPFMISMNKQILKQQSVFYSLTLIFALIYVFTSDNKNFLIGIYAVKPVAAFAVSLTLYEFFRNRSELFSAASLLSMLLIFLGLVHSYGYVYGEGGIGIFYRRALWRNAQIEEGIFKYMITSKEKKNYLEQMQVFVRANVSDEDKLCVVTLEPEIYSFTNAEIYTPWTFDAQYLWAGFRSSRAFTEYFEFYNRYPDVLVATNRVNRDFYDNPKYEINGFIDEHYTLAAQKTIEDITVRIWRLKN